MTFFAFLGRKASPKKRKMDHFAETWSLVVILLSAFVIGWGAEIAQTFIPRALALTLLAWLQTAPEFAVEAAIAWRQQRDLMIANLTGSLRLIVGLGWPMIFFTHLFFQGWRKGKRIRKIRLEAEDSLSVLFLFLSVLYFIVILIKASLTVYDAAVLILIYVVYLVLSARLPVHAVEDPGDLPWIGRKIVKLEPGPKAIAVGLMFSVGGVALYLSVHPFIDTLQRWSLSLGISTFVFVQWVAPFLSEFPEKVSAFNWARQPRKAGMAVMNMVGSNINQWTMLAAMIPIVFSVSLGRVESVTFDRMHLIELGLTIAQSVLAGMLLLDMEFSFWDAIAIFILWAAQFAVASLREEVAFIYCVWIVWELGHWGYRYAQRRELPQAFHDLKSLGLLGGR